MGGGSPSITIAPSFYVDEKDDGATPSLTVMTSSPHRPDSRVRDDGMAFSRVEGLHIARLHGS